MYRHTAAALEVRARRGQVPAVGQCRCQGFSDLLVVGAGLLKAHHIGGRRRQPVQQAEVLRGTFAHGGPDAVDVDGGDDHG